MGLENETTLEIQSKVNEDKLYYEQDSTTNQYTRICENADFEAIQGSSNP